MANTFSKLKKIGLVVLGALAFLWAIVLIPPVQTYFWQILSEKLLSTPEYKIVLKPKWSFLPLRLSFEGVTIHDHEKVLAEGVSIEASLSFRALLKGRISITQLHLASVTLYNTPLVSHSSSPFQTPSGEFFLASLLGATQDFIGHKILKEAHVERLRIEPAVFGQGMTLQAQVQSHPKMKTLTLESHSDEGRKTKLNLLLKSQGRGFEVSLDLQEDEGGLVTQLSEEMKGPKLGQFSLNLKGTIPHIDKPGKSSLQGQLNSEVWGKLNLSLTPDGEYNRHQLRLAHTVEGQEKLVVTGRTLVNASDSIGFSFKIDPLEIIYGDKNYHLSLAGLSQGKDYNIHISLKTEPFAPFLGDEIIGDIDFTPEGLKGKFWGIKGGTPTGIEADFKKVGSQYEGSLNLQNLLAGALFDFKTQHDGSIIFSAQGDALKGDVLVALFEGGPQFKGNLEGATLKTRAHTFHGFSLHGEGSLNKGEINGGFGRISSLGALAPGKFNIQWTQQKATFLLESQENLGQSDHKTRYKLSGNYELKTADVSLQEVSIFEGQDLLRLEAPLKVNFNNFSVGKARFMFNKSPIEFSGLGRIEGQWKGLISWSELSVGCLSLFMEDLELIGSTTGKLKFEGEGELPHFALESQFKNVNLKGVSPQKFSGLNGFLKGRWLQDLADWHVSLKSAQNAYLNSKGKMSLVAEGETLEGTLDGELPLVAFAPFMEYSDRIDGLLKINMSVRGKPSNPEIKGFLNLDNGMYENGDLGTLIEQINLRAVFEPGKLVINSLTAHDGKVDKEGQKKGGVTGAGFINFSKWDSVACQVTLVLDELEIARGDTFAGQASGELSLVGVFPKITAEGNVSLTRGELFLDEVSDDTIKYVNVKGIEFIKKKETEEHYLPLNIKIHSPGTFRIKGLGIDSEWGGDVMLKGHITRTLFVGPLELVKGKVNVFGKQMEMTRGRIDLDDENDRRNPYFSILSKRDADGTEIYMTVEGKASRPRVSFASSPALPEEEVLSRLLFGNEANKISVGQSIQLASALAKMNGKKGADFFDQFKNAFGLDTVDLKEVENEKDGSVSQAISVGKEFGKFRISIDQSNSAQTSKATVEATVAPNVNINADVGGNRSSGVGIDWVKRY